MAQVNREHKDRLFNYIFGQEKNKEWILSLYNAVNNSEYKNAEEIELTTLEDVLYMGMKNDSSFILHGIVSLWEHQSSYNPNMPVRELMYVAKLYDKYIHEHKQNIYGEKQICLPLPKLVVFYNGLSDQPDESILQLSDSFPEELKDVEADVSVRVRMLNINRGRNLKLMKQCKPLDEYAWFIGEIREQMALKKDIETAVEEAINLMPEDYQIKPFLIGNKAEVKDMCLTEYKEEETMQLFREEGREEGREEERQANIEKVARNYIEYGIASTMEEALEKATALLS